MRRINMRSLVVAAAAAIVATVLPITFASTASATENCQDSLKGVYGKVTADKVNKTGTLQVSVPSKACDDLQKVFGDFYTLPITYNGSGSFNATASPQTYIQKARTELVIRKGEKSASTTVSLEGVCNWVQGDLYTGPQRLDTVLYPTGHGKSGFVAGKIADLGECAPPDIIMPKATVSSICEIGQATAVIMTDNTMSTVPVLFKATLSNGKTAEKLLEPGTEGEILVSYEGNVTVTVTAVYNDVVQLEFFEQLSSDQCDTPPTVVVDNKASIAGAKCVVGGNGTSTSLVTMQNDSFVEGAKPNTDDMSAATAKFDVSTSAGFHKVITVPSGQVETLAVPLVEDKKVTVTIKDVATGKVLARKAITANCVVTDIDTPSKTPPTIGTPPTLADTGAREIIAILGALLVALGLVAYFGYDSLALYFSRRRTGASAS